MATDQPHPHEQSDDSPKLIDPGAVRELGPESPVIIPRWIQLISLPLALLLLWTVLNKAGSILLLFIFAALLALVLNPFVTLLRKLRVPRGIAVMVVLLILAGIIVGVAVLLVQPISDQITSLRESVPFIVSDANHKVDSIQDWLDNHNIGIHIADQGRTAVETLGDRLTKGSKDVLSFTREALQLIIETSFALILILVLAIYMLLYGEKIGHTTRRVMPRTYSTIDPDYPTRIQRAVFGYVRGQVVFSLIMGVSTGLMLWILGTFGIFAEGKKYALVFGVLYGIAEAVPYVGPIVGALPPILIALVGSSPIDAVWLAIGFLALQQIEGHVVAPNVFGQVLRINPVLVMFALLLGAKVYGLLGAFVALPIAAVIRETVLYLREHIVFEAWEKNRDPR